MTATELFARIVGLLERCGISYMLTGSYAAAFHGHPRATQDLDIVIAATRRQIQQFVSELAPSDFYVDIEAALEGSGHGGHEPGLWRDDRRQPYSVDVERLQ